MKKQCLDDWLVALRSGKYSSCSGALHRGDSFCALGVLCDISGLGTWTKDTYSNKEVYLGEINYLPKEVREWAGISEKEYASMSSFVMVFNDKLKASHSQMADFLEEKYKKKKES
jgi:hypothetical protein